MSNLTVPSEGCCKGHPCDNCATCQKGRCCRRDNPNYKLPELGSWEGPVYGALGKVDRDGNKVECHCCGEWFVSVGNHAWMAHDLLAKEYKAIFGLRMSTSLAGEAHSKQLHERGSQPKQREHMRQRVNPLGQAALTPEQRSANSKAMRRNIPEVLMSPEHAAKRHEKAVAAGETIKQLFREGKGWKNQHARKPHVMLKCAICGVDVRSVPENAAKRIQYGVTCKSPGCVSALKKRIIADLLARPEHREKIKARRPAAPKTHCKRGHPLSGDNVRIYKGARYCRECNRLKNAAQRSAN
jgi:hypothetical protein